jgi:hypothetical protein
MKDKLAQFGFYLLYLLCTVGMFFGIFWNQPIMIPFCMFMAVIGVVAEADHFRPTWPIKGSDDYKAMVHKFQSAIQDGREQARQKHYYKD